MDRSWGRRHWELITWLCVGLAWLATTPAQAGGALDRFQQAHQPKPSPSPSSSSDDDDGGSSSYDSSYDYGSDSYDDDDGGGTTGSSSSGGDNETEVAAVVFCMIPTFSVPCLMPVHRVRAMPYGDGGLYIEPQGERSEHAPAILSDVVYDASDYDAARDVELTIGSYLVMNEPGILSHDLRLTTWLGPTILAGSWEHFYERLPNGAVDHLNFYRMHYGFNLFGPYVDGLEVYPLFGALLLHGNDDVIPAFDIGADVRIYPQEPLAIGIRSLVSFFEVGPVLLDTRAQIGLALDRVEIRAGPRVLYQGDAQGFWGPSADFSVRF